MLKSIPKSHSQAIVLFFGYFKIFFNKTSSKKNIRKNCLKKVDYDDDDDDEDDYYYYYYERNIRKLYLC